MKFLLAAATGVLLLLSGCTCSPASPSGDAATAAPSASPTGELLQVLDPLARLTGAHVLMGDAETVNGGTYDSFFEDEVALLISSGALESTGLQIDKTGDAQNLEEALSYGLNAAVHVRDAGIATLTDTLLTTNGLGAAGVFCTGDGSSAILSGGLLSTAGEASPAIAALDGAAVQLQDTELLTDSLQSPCLLARGGAHIEAAGIRANASEAGLLELEDASLTLDNCTLSGAGARLSGAASLTATGGALTASTADALFTLTGGEATVSLTGVALTRSGGGALLSVLSGRLSLLCDYQALEGELSVADGATLSVTLQNNSTFTGSVSADERMRLSLSLDATSRWFVTGDSYLEALSDADATLQNIESNGFTIYYNSENEANAWLGSKPYALPGGGYLSPLI